MNYSSALSVTMVLTSLVATTHLYAEDQALNAEGGVPLGSVTVIGDAVSQSSSLGSTPLHQLPLNSYVINRSDITRLQFVDPDDVLDRIPGETQVRNLRIPAGGKGYTIPMVDGIPLENPYEGATQRLDRVNTADIDSIQVIKGPSSALYGNNALGGVVNVISREPAPISETEVWTEAGNLGRHRSGVNTSGTVNSGAAQGLGYFFDANRQRLNGLRDGEKDNRNQFSGKLVYAVDQKTRILTRLEYFKHDQETRGDLTKQQLNDDKTQAAGLSSATELNQKSAALKLEHRNQQHYLDAVFVVRQKDTIGLSRFRGPQDAVDKNYQGRLLYNYDFSRAHNSNTLLAKSDLTLGLDGYRGKNDVKQYDRKDVNLTGDADEFDTQFSVNAYFAQYRLQPTEQLTLTAGGRYEEIRHESSIYDKKAEFENFAPKLGLNYAINNNHMLWTNIAQGFYAPDSDDLFDKDNGNPDLKQEKSLDIELGVRGISGDFVYDTGFYHNRIRDYLVTQEFEKDGNEFERTTNAGQVTVKGIETVLEYAPATANWRAGFTHTLAYNKYDDFDSVKGDFSGNRMSRSPLNHVNVRLAWLPVIGLTAELEGDFYSSYYSDDANSRAGKFTRDERINLRLTYEVQQWRFWFNAMNLTDTLEDRASYSRGKLKFRTAAGRNYYAGVGYQF